MLKIQLLYMPYILNFTYLACDFTMKKIILV